MSIQNDSAKNVHNLTERMEAAHKRAISVYKDMLDRGLITKAMYNQAMKVLKEIEKELSQ